MTPIKLIDSNYVGEEALVVIRELISEKINFLDRKMFSNAERGLPFEHFKTRRDELNRIREELEVTALFSENEAYHISCEIVFNKVGEEKTIA
ncbi:hypothetical protein OAI64_02335 [Schleiferiaceae bacterium]|jgi:DNA polymerase III delta subunit|nr:hypothetical protein [Bacteroidota bacterium]MDA8529092.1 hypothetical protein [Schleiferiaceae bacterium]MDA8581632.1 hypothetical protein [Schleiferiaceae bacterium]MDA9791332.1 hypothetical protein [Schleiferiaceae bacterium]MDA9945849.1 hypothetical protein [Schleiferiaceae bacterium]